MIEQILERIAEAVEGVNSKLEAIIQGLAEPDDISTITSEVMPFDVVTSDPVLSGIAVETPVPADIREELLTQCKNLGIDVPKGTRTATLQKWVDKENKDYDDAAEGNYPKGNCPEGKLDLPSSVQPAIDISGVSIPPTKLSEPESSPEYTRDDVRKALISLCKEKGDDISLCRDILTYCGAASISELEESKFSDVMARIKKYQFRG